MMDSIPFEAPIILMDFHAGELAVQALVGFQDEVEALRKRISAVIQPAAQTFLLNKQFAIAGSVDPHGQVWASLLTGELGFVKVVAEQIVQLNVAPTLGDPLETNLRVNNNLGLLVIDLANRRRLRLNGKVVIQPDGTVQLHTDQVYLNWTVRSFSPVKESG